VADGPDAPDGTERPDEHGVRLEHEPGTALATVVLDRPEKRNAQTPAMWRRLASIGGQLLADDAVRVVLLRAEGSSFSAGLDRAMFTTGLEGEPGLLGLATLDDAALDETIDGFQQAFAWWRDDRLVSIAAVQGYAVGAGFQLALGCDLRVVADDVQLAMKETSLGLVPDLGGTRPLVDLVGYARALEICVTGRWVGADEAVASGLATVAVPAADLDETARDLAAAVLAAPAGAVRATKALLRGARNRGYHDQRAAERAAQAGRLRELARAVAATAGDR
jgi:enoyl-CoA hydratase/carnithine racemase